MLVFNYLKLTPYLELFLFLISVHPLFHIAANKKYQYSSTGDSLYISNDWFSNVATNPITIILSIILCSLVFFINSWLLILPLLLITWICFIRDRFKSLARGLGAPGYFSFLFALTLISNFLIYSKSFTPLFTKFTPLSFLIDFLFAITYVEFGFIFFSAGLFKILDAKESPISFALGLLNPMWSKIYMYIKFTEFNRVFLNWLGPILQIISGLFIISTVKIFSIIGFFLIIIMFLSITPFTRLGWLCPAIASLSFYHLLQFNYVNLISLKTIFLAIFLRSIVYIYISTQYFGNLPKLSNKISRSLVYLYRRYLGVIIWKVFTFDIVRNLAITDSKIKLTQVSPLNNNQQAKKNFIELSSNTNVYDSITVSSLIASGDYLEPLIFQSRVNHFCRLMDINKLITFRVSPEKASEKYQNKGPFMSAEIRVLSQQWIDDYDNNKEYNFIDYKSKKIRND